MGCHPQSLEAFGYGDVDEAVRTGRVAFDPEAAARCIEELEDSIPDDCGFEVPEPGLGAPSCLEAWRGTVPEGGACASRIECAPGTECRIGAECPGTCVEIELPRRCSRDSDCVAGSYCFAGTCLAGLDEGETCRHHGECRYGLVCFGLDDGWSGTGTCRPIASEGEPCVLMLGYSMCQGDLMCVGATADAPGICAVGASVGEACGPGQPCAPWERCDGARCVPLSGPGGAGGSAMNRPLYFSCAAGRCAPSPVVGEPCGADARCVEGVCGEEGTCRLGRDGEECVDDFGAPFGACEGKCVGHL